MPVPTAVQIAAARRWAPPLVVQLQADRRGARLRAVNRRAVDYARRAGMRLEDVYPGGLATVRALAPPPGTAAATTFLRTTGLSAAAVYPPPAMSGEASAQKGWRWGWAALGVLAGAALGGPAGAAVGGVLGAVAGRSK